MPTLTILDILLVILKEPWTSEPIVIEKWTKIDR